jgi:hypothetical protein
MPNLTNCIRGGSNNYLREHTKEGLHLIPGKRISNESDRFTLESLQEGLRVKARQVAAPRFPSPILVVCIGSSVSHAVLSGLHVETGRVRVQRAFGIPFPVPVKEIALFCRKRQPRCISILLIVYCETNHNLLNWNVSETIDNSFGSLN